MDMSINAHCRMYNAAQYLFHMPDFENPSLKFNLSTRFTSNNYMLIKIVHVRLPILIFLYISN